MYATPTNQNWPLFSGDPADGRAYLKVYPHQVTVGTMFDTEAETGCLALTAPDEYGNFDAIDSEGVRCAFGILMVTAVWS